MLKLQTVFDVVVTKPVVKENIYIENTILKLTKFHVFDGKPKSTINLLTKALDIVF